MARSYEGAAGKVEYVEPSPGPILDLNELLLWSFYRAISAEFVATFLFVYITVSTIIGQANQKNACAGVEAFGIAWDVGGMIFVLVYCTAGISGGHINPAVTFAMLLAQKVSLNRAVLYMLGHCVGAICGAGIVKYLQKTNYSMRGGGVNSVSVGYTKGSALGAEIIDTFVLVYTVFSATDRKRNARDFHVPVLASLPTGFALIMVHCATIPITGTGINLARSFGPAVIYNHNKSWDHQWIFWVGLFIGAAIVAAYHQCLLRASGLKPSESSHAHSTTVTSTF